MGKNKVAVYIPDTKQMKRIFLLYQVITIVILSNHHFSQTSTTAGLPKIRHNDRACKARK